jgi:hypothetical protein
MFLVVQIRLATVPAVTAVAAVLAALAGLAAPVAVARQSSRGPTAAQIRAAIRRAERSRDLWATVNICNTKRHPHTIGIRGQMPSLGFASLMYMEVRIDYWLLKDKKFVLDPAVIPKSPLPVQLTHGLLQDGALFVFKPPVILSGEITFTWKRGGKVLGRAHRKTSHGQKHVDMGDPHGYSTATCRILK